MPVSIISPPAVLPITLPQIKQHLRIDHGSDDEYLTSLGESATAHVEAEIRQSLIVRDVRQFVDASAPGTSLLIEVFPVISITSVTGFKLDGEPEIISSENYRLGRDHFVFTLEFTRNFYASSYPNGLEVDITCGYGASGVDVPSNITRALLLLIAHWYEHRGAQSASDETAIIPSGLEALLNPVRRKKL